MAPLLRKPLPLMVVALAFFYLASPVLGDAASTEVLINAICMPLQGDSEFCKGVFHEILRGGGTDSHGLAYLVQKAATLNATLNGIYILKELEKPTDKATKNALSECKDAYDLIVSQFQQGYSAFMGSKYQDTYFYDQKAEAPRKSCETTFKIPPVPPVDLMAERNRQMGILITMALSTLDKLIHQ